ncbi:MAG TPA: hypothetical protein VFZ32_02440 [Micromonosporaceae bacterium]
MDSHARQPALNRLLDHAYRERLRCSRDQVRVSAETLELPSALLARVAALPNGEYTREELVTALPRGDEGVWRDESRVPLADLDRAMGGYSADGQVDDDTGGDAGAEAEFGEDAWPGAGGRRDPDPDTEEGRRLRPSPGGGRIGPV